MNNLTSGSEGSSESEAGWFDLFSSRYWKGKSETMLEILKATSRDSYLLECTEPVLYSF